MNDEHAGYADLMLVRERAGAVGTAEDYWRMRWAAIAEPGDRVVGALLAMLPAKKAFDLVFSTPGAPPRDSGITLRDWKSARERWLPRAGPRALAQALRVGALGRAALLLPRDQGWPEGFHDLGPHAPISLWLRGKATHLGRLGRSVAVVGARAATSYGNHIAEELSAELAGDDITVVSGAAYGIDGAAHRGALGVRGTTFAFLAGGVDRAYPAGHATLIDTMAERGLVLSEVLPSSAPTRWRFLARNRLIAAASSGTVVIEAGTRSGSLNTASHAATLGRPLGAVPGPVTSSASAGCHRLIRDYGAELVTNASDVREMLGETRDLAEAQAPEASAVDLRLEDAMSRSRARPIAELAERSGLSERDVSSSLGVWELQGRAERTEKGWKLCAQSKDE